jgi:hypothetical protein
MRRGFRFQHRDAETESKMREERGLEEVDLLGDIVAY